MYQLLLTSLYLRSKVMPMLAAVAVALCTLMVLVIWSVMSGFLGMLINTGRTLSGDVSISWPGVGFAHYHELIDDLRKDPMILDAAPAIETFGSITVPGGGPRGVAIVGIDGPSYANVTQYDATLWWRSIDKPLPKDGRKLDPRLGPDDKPMWDRILENGRSLSRTNPETGEVVPAMVPGVHVTGLNRRRPEGFYTPMQIPSRASDGSTKMLDAVLPLDNLTVPLTVFPIDRQGRPYEAFTRPLVVANEFHSGLFEVDKSVVFVNLGVLQEMLKMHEGLRVADTTGPAPAADAPATPAPPADAAPQGETFAGGSPPATYVKDPARVTTVLVKARGDVSQPREAAALRERVEEIYDRFALRHEGQVPNTFEMNFETWEDKHSTFINAVRTERTLLLFLFMIVSLTAVALVLAIFWSMVREKTQDVGVLRSLGASRVGVASLWVSYGLAIGIVGAALGLAGSYLLVININSIHDWLGEAFGLVIWNPNVYYFTVIPNTVDTFDAVVVFICGVLSCGIGAIVPASRAALMNPVAALRNE